MKKFVAKALVFSMVVAAWGTAFTGTNDAQAAKKAKLSTKKVTLTVGKSKKVTLKNAKKATKISWKSSKKKIAKVTKSGKFGAKIKAVKKGTAKVTCSFKIGKKKQSLKISVKVNAKKVATKAPATAKPTTKPTVAPTVAPTAEPTVAPTAEPTVKPSATPVVALSTLLEANFDDGQGGFTPRGTATLALADGGVTGKCLSVTGRAATWAGAGYEAGKEIESTATYHLTAYMKQSTGAAKTLSCTYQSGQSTYIGIDSKTAKSGEWVKFEADFKAPKSFSKFLIYFESPDGEFDFLVDDVKVVKTIEGDPIVTVDPNTLDSIKDTYKDLVPYMGAAINYNNNGNKDFDNPDMLSFIKRNFNSFTLENEMKPEAMLNSSLLTKQAAIDKGYVIPDTYTEEKVPTLNFDKVDKVLEAASKNGLKVRAHTLVWHSQTPDWFFNTGYTSSGKKVSKEVMDARMEFYIRTMMNHVYDNQYGDVVYAWDVCNEYFHSNNGGGWNAVYGYTGKETNPSYVKKAFVIAHDVLVQKGIADKVSLFYNDYNTYQEVPEVIALINFLNEDGKICNGIGMQSHLDADYPDAELFGSTIASFAKEGFEIQMTELDFTINYDNGFGKNENQTEDDQAAYVASIMKAVVEQIKAGANITNITLWGITDATSWRADGEPLLFGTAINNPKKSFYEFINAAK